MDQTESEDQNIPWDIQECRPHADLGGHDLFSSPEVDCPLHQFQEIPDGNGTKAGSILHAPLSAARSALLYRKRIAEPTEGKSRTSNEYFLGNVYGTALAAFAYPFGMESVPFLRFLSLIFGIFSLFAFYRIVKMQESTTSLIRTAQYVFLPILYPFFFLLYSDVVSISFVIFSWFFLQKKQYAVAGLFGMASILIRQHNVVWIFFLLLLLPTIKENLEYLATIIVKNGSFTSRMNRIVTTLQALQIRVLLRQSWSFIVAMLLFIVFIFWNGGVALGDAEHHPFPTFYTGNILFCLFLSSVLFFPIHLANFYKIISFIRKNGFVTIFMLLMTTLAIIYFKNDHTYNQETYDFFMRNKILLYFSAHWWRKFIFAIPIIFALFSHIVTEWRHPVYIILLPLSVLYLSQSWLIEQRYYLLPFVFFLLMRASGRKDVEYAQVFLSIILSLFLYDGIVELKFFL